MPKSVHPSSFRLEVVTPYIRLGASPPYRLLDCLTVAEVALRGEVAKPLLSWCARIDGHRKADRAYIRALTKVAVNAKRAYDKAAKQVAQLQQGGQCTCPGLQPSLPPTPGPVSVAGVRTPAHEMAHLAHRPLTQPPKSMDAALKIRAAQWPRMAHAHHKINSTHCRMRMKVARPLRSAAM